MASGIPYHGWLWFHSLHHKYNNDQKGEDGRVRDPVSFYRFGQNTERENFWSYCVTGIYRDFKGVTLFDPNNTCRSKINPSHINIVIKETWIIYLYLASIFCINFYYGLFYLLVWILSLIGNNAKSYGEHYLAVEPKNYRSNSVGSYGRLFNLLCLNNGYHQEHHVNPNLHWTRLPELTTTLPKNRKTIRGMYAFNTPWWNDFKKPWSPK
jgi:fatty acid desaturase